MRVLESDFSIRLLLVLLAMCMNLIFLYFYNPQYHFTLTQLHGQVGYNINTYGSVNINPEITKVMDDKRQAQGQLIDFDTLDASAFNPPYHPFVTNDTIGYGLVLGLLWKLTHRFCFAHVQWLQILLFSLLMLLLFGIAFILFKNRRMAFLACLAQLFFFPIIAMNVQPSRDIWAYYGIVILLYGVVTFIFQRCSPWRLALSGALFGACQFVRPSVFLALLTLTLVCGIYGLVYKKYLKRITCMIAMLWAMNGLCFWMPFMIYNQRTYHRYMVGPVGLDLLEGLGEFPNRWGYKLDDIWAADYICKKYGVQGGTPEFDDKAKEEFTHAFQQEPLTYFINIFKRLPGLILPGLPWIFYTQSPYGAAQNIREKLTLIFSSWDLFLDFLARHVYVRLYILLGYIGIILLVSEGRYWIVSLLVGGVLVGGLGKLPSHIEYRYVVPYYWVFAWFAAYALSVAFNALKLQRGSQTFKNAGIFND